MKKLMLLFLALFGMFQLIAAQDSIFIKLKDGKMLAYSYGNKDTVSVNEKYTVLRDTTILSGHIRRITFSREVSGTKLQLVSFKLRYTDNNKALLGKNFSADNDALVDNDTIRIVVPYLYDFNMVPYFVPQFASTSVYIGETKIIPGESRVDFTHPVKMRLESPDGDYRTYIVVIKNSGLPIIQINTPNNSTISSKTVWKENTGMVVYNSDGTINFDAREEKMNIRGRGNSTWSYPKKPYNIKLNSKSSILGMPKQKRWCLLANYIDRTLIRNAVAFELAKMTSMQWAPNGCFVELVVNGSPLGNYYLCEAIRIDKSRVDINEMTINDKSGENITGGYILELDTYYDATWKFRTNYYNMPVNIKQPDDEDINNQQHSYIRGYYNSMEYQISSRSWSGINNYLDLNSLVDWYLLNEVVHNRELGHPKSSYMYKDKNNKLHMGPAWDHDWGTFTINYSGLVNNNSMWFGTLFTIPEFRSLVKERWNMLKDKFSDVDNFIEELRTNLRDSWEYNFTLWAISVTVNGDTSLPFDASFDRLKQSIDLRVEYMDAAIKNL